MNIDSVEEAEWQMTLYIYFEIYDKNEFSKYSCPIFWI